MREHRLHYFISLGLLMLALAGCQLNGYRTGYYAQAGELSPTLTPGETLNGYTPSTAPTTCYGNYVACPTDLQSIVDQLFYLCTVPVRRLCDDYGRPLLPEQFCVSGTEGYTQNQVLNNCSPITSH